MKSFRKYLSLLLVLVMTFSFVSCEMATDESLTKILEKDGIITLAPASVGTAMPASFTVRLTSASDSSVYTDYTLTGTYSFTAPIGDYVISFPASTGTGLFADTYDVTVSTDTPVTKTVYPFVISAFTTEDVTSDTVAITAYSGKESTLYVPNVINGKTVVGIGNGSTVTLASDTTKVTSLIVPSSVTSIGSGAFSGNTDLASVSFAGNVSIGDSAFSGCTNITEADFEGVPAQVAANAFSGWTSSQTIWFKGVDDSATVSEWGKGTNAVIRFGSEGAILGYSNTVTFTMDSAVPEGVTVTISITGTDYSVSIPAGETEGKLVLPVGDYSYTVDVDDTTSYEYSVTVPETTSLTLTRTQGEDVSLTGSFSYGSISVPVTFDSNSGVTVTVTATGTSATRTATISADGTCLLESLPAGTYELSYTLSQSGYILSRTSDSATVERGATYKGLAELTVYKAIGTASEFIAFVKEVAADTYGTVYSGKTVVLTEDITLSESDAITATGTGTFAGTFDGNSKTITGLVINSETNYTGIFSSLKGTVQDLTIINAKVTSKGYYTGIIAGRATDATITNVKINGAAMSGAAHIGALVGRLASGSKAVISGVEVVSVTIESTDSNEGNVGGIVGNVTATNLGSVKITDAAVNNCTISGTRKIGGIIGWSDGAASSAFEISDCSVSGTKITASGLEAGGLAGSIIGACALTGNTVDLDSGSISASDYAGGILGFASDPVIDISGNTVKDDTLGTNITATNTGYITGSYFASGVTVSGNTVNGNPSYGYSKAAH